MGLTWMLSATMRAALFKHRRRILLLKDRGWFLIIDEAHGGLEEGQHLIEQIWCQIVPVGDDAFQLGEPAVARLVLDERRIGLFSGRKPEVTDLRRQTAFSCCRRPCQARIAADDCRCTCRFFKLRSVRQIGTGRT
jgi:hypothetical protein